MKYLLSTAFFFILSTFAFSQSNTGRPSIFIDCQMNCDFTYIKQEVTFINYMQNREEADVYILATRQSTGAGGREIQLTFIGNQAYQALRDTILYNTDPNATDAIERELFVENLKKGLLPYLLKSSLADQITYSVSTEGLDTQEESIDDPWNYWVFNIGGNVFINGEQSFSGSDLTGRFNASRVTDKSKFRYGFRYNYEQSKFTLTDGEEFISIIRRFNNDLLWVKSVSANWSLGFRAEAGSSSFGNTDFYATIKPAIEYNIFPYDDSSTRRFSFLYSLGPEYKNYTDTTVFNKVVETVVRHGLDIEFEQTQKWGSLEFDMGVNQYLHDLSLWSMYINPNLEWVVFKGLSLDFGGFASFVGDRINIARSDITDEDILLQIKQLDTDFTYFTYIGINYRFGSSYNNFVNPRF